LIGSAMVVALNDVSRSLRRRDGHGENQRVSLEDEARDILRKRDQAASDDAARRDRLHAEGRELVELFRRSEVVPVPLKRKYARTAGWILRAPISPDREGYGGSPGVVLAQDGLMYEYEWSWRWRNVGRQLDGDRRMLLAATTSVLDKTFRHADGGSEFSGAGVGCVIALVVAILVVVGLGWLIFSWLS
jgi:hypothetical protein